MAKKSSKKKSQAANASAAGSSTKAAKASNTAKATKADSKKADNKKDAAKKQSKGKSSAKADAKNANAKKKDKKPLPGWIAKIVAYFKSVRTEMKRVVWPSKKELINYSVAVCLSLVAVGVFIGLLDAIISGGLVLFAGLRG